MGWCQHRIFVDSGEAKSFIWFSGFDRWVSWSWSAKRVCRSPVRSPSSTSDRIFFTDFPAFLCFDVCLTEVSDQWGTFLSCQAYFLPKFLVGLKKFALSFVSNVVRCFFLLINVLKNRHSKSEAKNESVKLKCENYYHYHNFYYYFAWTLMWYPRVLGFKVRACQ